MKTYNFEEVVNFIKNYFDGYVPQCFSSRNIVGDEMKNIYSKDGVDIDYCAGWDYIEVFGLSKEDFNTLYEMYIKDFQSKFK